MALADLLEAIAADTKQRTARLEKIFAMRAATIASKYTAREQEMIAASMAQGERECAKLQRKGDAFLNMERKNALLQARKKLVDQLYQEIQVELVAGPEYQRLLVSWLRKAGVELAAGTLIPAQGQKQQLAQALAASKVKYELDEESGDFQGGFRVSGKEADLDFTLESLIGRSLREQTEIKVAQLLFG